MPRLDNWNGRGIEDDDIVDGMVMYLVGNSDPRIIYTIHFAYAYLFMVASRLTEGFQGEEEEVHDDTIDDGYDRDTIFEPSAGVLVNKFGHNILVASDFVEFKNPLYRGPNFKNLSKADDKFVLLNRTTVRAVHLYVPVGEDMYDVLAIGGSASEATLASVQLGVTIPSVVLTNQ